jgi:hypothetical protein
MWMAMPLFLQIVGGVALLTWLLFSENDLRVKILATVAAGLLLVALYSILAALKQRQIRKEIAEKICAVSFVRPPRWNNRPVEEYALRGPAVKALMAKHDQIARDVESAIRTLGYSRKETRKAIAIGRYEHGMYTYEGLFDFAHRKLITEGKKIPQVREAATLEGKEPKSKGRAHNAGH